MTKKKGLLFDMDGTLMDSMWIWDRLPNLLLEQHGITCDRPLAKELGGNSVLEAVRRLKRDFGLALSPQELAEQSERIVEDAYRHRITALKGAAELLRLLHREGYPMALVTATPRTPASIALERFDMLECFDFMLTEDEAGKSKRDPDIYLQAAARLDRTPEQCIVFEDAPHAALTAFTAGFTVVGVTTMVQQLEPVHWRVASPGELLSPQGTLDMEWEQRLMLEPALL